MLTTTSQFTYVRSRHIHLIIHTSLTIEVHGTTEIETKNNLMTKNLSGAGEQGIFNYIMCSSPQSHRMQL